MWGIGGDMEEVDYWMLALILLSVLGLCGLVVLYLVFTLIVIS